MIQSGRAAGCPELQRDPPSVAGTVVDRVKDLRVEPDVGVVVLPTREPIRSNIDFAWAMDSDEEDLCLIAHGLEVPSDAVHKQRSATQVIYVCLRYLVVRLDEHHLAAEVLEAHR